MSWTLKGSWRHSCSPRRSSFSHDAGAGDDGLDVDGLDVGDAEDGADCRGDAGALESLPALHPATRADRTVAVATSIKGFMKRHTTAVAARFSGRRQNGSSQGAC